MNQILERYLQCFIAENKLIWPNLLDTAQFACNNVRNSTIGTSPYHVIIGQDPEFHIQLEADPSQTEVPAASTRVEKLEQIRQRCNEEWEKNTEKYKKNYDKYWIPMTFTPRQKVKLNTKNLKFKTSAKLKPRFIGPIQVISRVRSNAYRLWLPDKYSQIHNIFHVSLLEPWQGDSNTDSPPDLEEDKEWEIDDIIDYDTIDNEESYLVK